MGTPDFAVPSLRALVSGGHDIVGVFTQPDRPAGRGKNLKPSPVKVAAEELGLPVFQPIMIKTSEGVQLLRTLAPECVIVVAYGQILSKEILTLPPKGCINVHASLLPAYRGAAPIHWAVMNGETHTGVTTMMMDEGLDTGDMLLKREVSIPEEATTGEIHDLLAGLGGTLLLETLRDLEMGALIPIPQTGESNYAHLLSRNHERLDWSRRAKELHDQIRGLNPWPGAFATFRGEPLKFWRSSLIHQNDKQTELGANSNQADLVPGQINRVIRDGLLVQTGEGMIEILVVQPAGKRPMSARAFFNGRQGMVGEKFE
jgi:methionyl-tRNA formyltransferase